MAVVPYGGSFPASYGPAYGSYSQFNGYGGNTPTVQMQQYQPYWPTGFQIPGVNLAPNDGLPHPAYQNTTKYVAPPQPAPLQYPFSITPDGTYANQFGQHAAANTKEFFVPRVNNPPVLYRPFEKPIYRDGQPVTSVSSWQPRRQYEKPRIHWNIGGTAATGGPGTMYF